MANVASVCVHCGAPMPGATPGVEMRCPFCKTAQTPIAPPPANPYAPQPMSDAARVQIVRDQIDAVHRVGTSAAKGVVVFAVLLVCLISGIGVAAFTLVSRAPAPSATTGPAPLAVAELASWTEARPRVLETTGMPGSIAAVDPVAIAPWALGVARAWSPDAEIDGIQVDEVSPQGTVDARTPRGRVQFTFASPARRDAFARMQQVNDRPNVMVYLRIRFDDGQVEVMQTSAGDVSTHARPPVTLGCTIPQLLAVAAQHGLPPRAVYDIDLQSLDRRDAPEWRWHIHRPPGSRMDETSFDPATCQPK